jgi:hypothetical protein
MSRIWLSMLAVVWMSAGMSGVASNHIVTIFGSGSGAFETPAVASAGVAQATCTMNSTTVAIACTARVHNIVGLTAGHMHVGGPGASGPVVLGISGLPVGSSDDFIYSWTWTESDLRLRAGQGVLKMADVFESCSSGNCYLNFHTATNPGGEIRINMCPQGAAEDRFANGLYQINVCAPGR